jgi:hypothetical protein
MIVHPRIGQRVRVHYRKAVAALMPLHGRTGRVVIRATGPGPRNHGVELDGGGVVAVPCGNLTREEAGR